LEKNFTKKIFLRKKFKKVYFLKKICKKILEKKPCEKTNSIEKGFFEKNLRK